MKQGQAIDLRPAPLPLTPELAARARAIARTVGERLANPLDLTSIGHLAGHPTGLAGGFPGLALFAGALDSAFPGQGWDRVAHQHLLSAIGNSDALARIGSSLHSGWAGLVLAADLLSRGGRRYRGFLDQADARLAVESRRLVRDVVAATPPIAPPLVDVISGLSGVAAILLLRRDNPDVAAVVPDAVTALAGLATMADGLPRASSPSTWGAPILPSADSPILNFGLSHGIPGPIAALSLAFAAGIRVDGQATAIETLVDLVLAHGRADEWGPTWPHGAAVNASGPRAPNGRMAWCYGPPGCARALWLAGSALDRVEWRDLALRAMIAAVRRPARVRHVSAATLCHGLAGPLQIGVRFYTDTDDDRLAGPLSALLEEIVTGFDPAAPFGYRGLDRRNRACDDPGLLNGAAGVGLALLSASAGGIPSWDRALLLQ